MTRPTMLPELLSAAPLPQTADGVADMAPLQLRPQIMLDSPGDDVRHLADRAAFDALSERDEVPGAIGIREVKFLVTDVDKVSAAIHFIDGRRWQYHWDFATQALGLDLDLDAFNLATYFRDDRSYLAGTLLAHDDAVRADGGHGVLALEFWPTDPVSARLAILSYRLALAAIPFAAQSLAYHPSGSIQEVRLEAERIAFEQAAVRVVTTDEIYRGMTTAVLNPGVGFGTLRVVQAGQVQPPSIRDVVVYMTLPNDLPHVAGVISEEMQTPLSHVNLRAKQNDTPNIFLRDASRDGRLVPLIGSVVRFSADESGFQLQAATTEEVEQHIERLRPQQSQVPPRDLGPQSYVDLDQVGHAALSSVGAKAANLAELRRLLGAATVPRAFALPFALYDGFMEVTGLYDEIRRRIATEQFRTDATARDVALADIRKLIRRSRPPPGIATEVDRLRAAFPDDATIRCRSSTNNEDLPGFNGAGLYDSYTHRLDDGAFDVTVRKVWASLWNFRAFEEREFYRIDHFHTAMAVLVHRNFDDERANGVALTKNVYFPQMRGSYVNVQVGESLVTNPEGVTPDEFLIMENADPAATTPFDTIYIRRSSLTASGTAVLTATEIVLLAGQLDLIQRHFRGIYQIPQNDRKFAMDVEFKIDREGSLIIKQARPWVD